jgi:plastocyanin
MKQFLIIGFLAAVIVMSGCSLQTTPVQPNTNPGGNLGIKKDIDISGFAFNPGTVTIPKGATVIWTNRDSVSHTVVSDTGSEIGSSSLSQGDTYAHTFDTPGTYDYHCGVHPSMKGTIIVQ